MSKRRKLKFKKENIDRSTVLVLVAEMVMLLALKGEPLSRGHMNSSNNLRSRAKIEIASWPCSILQKRM